MKSWNVVCAVLCAEATRAAFIPAAQQLPTESTARHHSTAVHMVASKDVYESYAEQAPALQRSLKSMTPAVASSTLNGVVAAAAAVGYIATPSSRIAVNAIGGAFTGGFGVMVCPW